MEAPLWPRSRQERPPCYSKRATVALEPSTRLGPYEITSALGAGGMGEVYKARDTRLGRDVAIKVLPATLAADPQFRDRFEREAKSISQLNHPNICTLFDVGNEAGVEFLVMEFIEGETLAARLGRGALPIADVLRIAIEIAGALDKAHRQGIIHRDLKPGNIMLTKSGSKLLDFGLAKMGVAGSLASSAPTALATSPLPSLQSPALTAQGTILGTFQYMAPEQVEGLEADTRSDIFAFGAVLFEMATGQRAFSAKSQASLLAAILEREPPPISQLVPVAPPTLDYLVRTCLAKDPDARFQTAHDLLLQLKWIAGEGSSTTATTVGAASPLPIAPRRKSRERLAWAIAGVSTLALAAVGAWSVLRPAVASPGVMRLLVPTTAPDNVVYVGNNNGSLALSPDGQTMVFLAGSVRGNGQLFQRRLDQELATPMPGTEIPHAPFFSPDGEWVGFASFGALKKVSTRGGATFTICPLPNSLRGASWGDDGFIYFSSSTGPVVRVAEGGGTPSPVTELRQDERNHRWVHVLPGGKAILYTDWHDTGFDSATVYAESLSTHTRELVARGGSDGRYVKTGHVVYARSEGLLAVPFNLSTLKTAGAARPVLEGVASSPNTGKGSFDVSTDGVLVYEPGADSSAMRSLVWADRKGVETSARAERGRYQAAHLSPNGKLMALEVAGANGVPQIWVFDPARGTLVPRTFEGASSFPVWSSDDKTLTYMSARTDGTSNVYRRPADGSGTEERLTTDKGKTQWPQSWSSDGKFLTVEEAGGGLSYLTMDPPTRHALLDSAWNKDTPRLSWDGKWLAYASSESGTLEITVQAFPSLGGKYVISSGGGTGPRWSRDGRELFYWAPPGRIMAVSVTTTPAFSSSKPEMLFEGPYLNDFDVSADGKRFLLVKEPSATSGTNHFNVIVNWFQELAAKK
ncbi:MAG: serine/threonine-protein kinase [Acidobacteria bacterium]|nr:MAG: serine/threonine-protein kinase [Acidobacteriota bacterium]